MAIVSGQTWTASVPHEEQESITFRRLSAGELKRCAEKHQRAQLEAMRGVTDLLKDIQSIRTEDITSAARDPATLYDPGELLKVSIASWSYDVEVDDPYNQLDPATAEWAVREILTQHSSRSPEERKNGSSGSTDSSAVIAAPARNRHTTG